MSEWTLKRRRSRQKSKVIEQSNTRVGKGLKWYSNHGRLYIMSKNKGDELKLWCNFPLLVCSHELPKCGIYVRVIL